MPYLFIGDDVPLLKDIFGFFFHTSFCGMRKGCNSFSFDSMPFFVDISSLRLVSDFRLASSTSDFKHFWLRGVLGPQFAEGLRVMASIQRPFRLVSWLRSPSG